MSRRLFSSFFSTARRLPNSSLPALSRIVTNLESGSLTDVAATSWIAADRLGTEGIYNIFGQQSRSYTSSSEVYQLHRGQYKVPSTIRRLSSDSTSGSSQKTRKDIATSEDPFDAPTYNIPEKPVTFTEGASYSVIILAGLGVAAAAAYAVFKELIFEPREYKVFGKALARVQNDSQVRVRIGSPVTGYGQESMNRAARQRIPNRKWTDEHGEFLHSRPTWCR